MSLVTVGYTAPSAGAACTQYVFLGARGSGESAGDYSASSNYGMGDTVFSVYDGLTKLAPAGSISASGVVYPAVGLTEDPSKWLNAAGAFLHIKSLGAYTDSARAGTANVQSQIESIHASCPDARFILSGYSQGAQAVGDAVQRMPQADRDLVAAAAFFGDPYRNAESWSDRGEDARHFGVLGVRGEYPVSLHGHIFSYCHDHDPICSISKKFHILGDGDIYVRDFTWFRGFDDHKAYVSAGDTTDAATSIAHVLHFTTTGNGNVPLDLAFVIDTTGSMGGVIATVRDNVSALADTIAATSTSYQFALADYKDDPFNDSPYLSRLDLGFTTDVTAFKSAVSTLTASGGGDLPESMFSGITTALDLPWRPGVRKVVLVIADAPGKDPEPVTGLTLGQVRDHALAVDPAQVYTVEFGADPSAQTFMQSVSDATGGRFTSADSTTTLVDTLKSAIVQAGSAPTASAGGPYTGLTSDAVVLSSAASRDASEPIAAYDWDFDGDGVYDVTSADPVVRHTYAAAGTYNVVLRARAASGLSGLATSTVTVIDPPAGPPATPTNLTATPGDTTATLSWSAGPGPLASWFVIRDGSGNVLDVVGADASGNPPAGWVDPALVNGTHYTYTLSAGNQVGESIQAGPVTVTPATSAPAQPYRFEGFYSPVVNGMLSGTAGRTVPLKWRLWKANGIPVTSLGAVTGVRFSRPGATTSLAYDKQYELIVKTPRAWARSRVTVDVALSDGTTHRAILVLK